MRLENQRITVKENATLSIDDSQVWVDFYGVLKKRAEIRTSVKFQGVEINLKRIDDKRYLVKKAYQIISSQNTPTEPNAFQTRVLLVQWLEKCLKTQFINTRDFRQKIDRYLKGYQIRKKPVGERLKKARKKKKISQKELAEQLGYKSHVTIAQFEKGLRYPPKKVFQWLEQVGM